MGIWNKRRSAYLYWNLGSKRCNLLRRNLVTSKLKKTPFPSGKALGNGFRRMVLILEVQKFLQWVYTFATAAELNPASSPCTLSGSGIRCHKGKMITKWKCVPKITYHFKKNTLFFIFRVTRFRSKIVTAPFYLLQTYCSYESLNLIRVQIWVSHTHSQCHLIHIVMDIQFIAASLLNEKGNPSTQGNIRSVKCKRLYRWLFGKNRRT